MHPRGHAVPKGGVAKGLLMLISVSELLLNTGDSPVVSANAERNYRFANLLPFLLLETKYGLRLELYKGRAFISNIHTLLSFARSFHEASCTGRFTVEEHGDLR